MGYRDAKKIDTALANISRKISFYIVNPTNLRAEEERFYSQRGYNPQFRYERYRANLDLLHKKLEAVKSDESVIGKILEEKRARHLKRISMLKSLGKEGFTPCSLYLYGRPSKELVEKAKALLAKDDGKSSPKSLVTEEVLSLLRDALDRNGLQKWRVVEEEMPAIAAVKPLKRILMIRKNEKFSQDIIGRLITHEIGTHVLRSENGSIQPFKIFQRGLPGYLKTEEGLAMVMEEMNGHLNKNILSNYAGRVLAVDMAQRASFVEVFEYLSQYFDAPTSFRLTTRAKRGISDTSKPGGLTKDYLYLDGYFAVKEFIENGGDIKKLYYGRIGIEHVPLLKDIPNLKKPALEISL